MSAYIKTWQERVQAEPRWMLQDERAFMQDEIDALRAALAQKEAAAPVAAIDAQDGEAT